MTGVRNKGRARQRLDALLSTSLMPGDMPVAPVAIGPADARNVASLATGVAARNEAAGRGYAR